MIEYDDDLRPIKRKRKKWEDEEEDKSWMDDGDIEPNDPGDGRIVRKRLEE